MFFNIIALMIWLNFGVYVFHTLKIWDEKKVFSITSTVLMIYIQKKELGKCRWRLFSILEGQFTNLNV
jgi:hypothetical protein